MTIAPDLVAQILRLILRETDTAARHGGDEFEAVNVIRTATLEVIGHADEVIAISGDRDLELAVQTTTAAAIVIAAEAAAFFVVNIHHAVERGAEALRKGLDLERHAFFER